MAHQTPEAAQTDVASNETATTDTLPAQTQLDPQLQAIVDAEVQKRLAEAGIETTPAIPPAKPPVLDALKAIAGEAEQLTFVQKLEKLADQGYQVVHEDLNAAPPVVRALFPVVEALVEKTLA